MTMKITNNKIYLGRRLAISILGLLFLVPAALTIALVAWLAAPVDSPARAAYSYVCTGSPWNACGGSPGTIVSASFCDTSCQYLGYFCVRCGSPDPVCGNGVCESGENAGNCSQDCGTCGDGFCGWGEHCTNCVADCGTCPYCGDGACNNGETCATCSGDCGSCCGNGVCDNGETYASCPSDCTPLPNATNDTATTDEDVAVEIDVLANDTTPVGALDPTSVTVTTPPPHGVTGVNTTSGIITYTPALDYFGTDQFVYRVCHTLSRCDTATVTITINGINDPPWANDDTATTLEDTAVYVDVLANDSDDGAIDPTTVTIITAPGNGSAEVDPATGLITYTPAPDYNGSDQLTYQVCDTEGACSTAVLDITITGENDPPTANPDQVSLQVNTSAAFDPVANDSDPDDILDPCSVVIIVQPLHGTLGFNPAPACQVVYTPTAGYSGTDSLDYQICDALGLCDSSTVTFTISIDPPQPISAPAPANYDPAVSKAGPAGGAVLGEVVPWSITVTNPHAQTSTAYSFDDPVPTIFDIQDVVVVGKATYSISGQTITFTIEPLQPGEQVLITVNTVANHNAAPGQVCNSLRPVQSANTSACAMLYPNTLPATGERTRLPILSGMSIIAVLVGGGWLIKKRR